MNKYYVLPNGFMVVITEGSPIPQGAVETTKELYDAFQTASNTRKNDYMALRLAEAQAAEEAREDAADNLFGALSLIPGLSLVVDDLRLLLGR